MGISPAQFHALRRVVVDQMQTEINAKTLKLDSENELQKY